MKMKVYTSRKLNLLFEMNPIVVETNIAWALPYWQKRKELNPKIFWEFVE